MIWFIIYNCINIVVVPLPFKLPIILTLFKVDWPDMLNEDNNLDELNTNKLDYYYYYVNL